MEHLDTAEMTRFLRGQLSPERASVVERHLATCRQCAEQLSAESEGVTEVPPGAEASYATGAAFAAQGSPPAAEPSSSSPPSSLSSSGSSPEPVMPGWVKEGRMPGRGEQVG